LKQDYQKTFISLLFIYLVLGIYLSINTGISHDEFHEQQNWIINFEAIKNFLTNGSYDNLLNYKDKYHGIGFHILSQPVQFFVADFLKDYLLVNSYGAVLISKHIVVFVLFFLSGIFFYLICNQLIKDKVFCYISTFIYLLYPYLFGHSLFNPKDIPFLSVWLICTYFIIRVTKDLIQNKKISLKFFLILSFLSAFLISIRIVGLLIFIQYFIFLFIYLENKEEKLIKFIKLNKSALLSFSILFIILLYLFNPIFWHDPLEILNSIQWMKKYQQDMCTITLGDCLKSMNLPANYYFIWLFFKLPILIILSLFLFPLIEKKIDKDLFSKIVIYSLLFTSIIIVLIFILLNVAVYDEIRHFMFILPMLILIGIFNLYSFNKKIFLITGPFLIIFFIFENFALNPYQYTWLNSFAKFYEIDKNFEVDYWGISGKNLNLEIKDHRKQKNLKKNICIYGGNYSKVFLEKYGFECFKSYSELDAAKDRPFYVIKNVRNMRRSNPKDCNVIHRETYEYNFSDKKVLAGSAWYCD
tara:strand:- start:1709 stop:3289 length:1581 start_codon:yes stop_codon:yes gene_type:complete